MSTDTLLFLHVLSAFMMVTAVGIFVAIGLALARDRYAGSALRLAPVAGVLWAVGGLAVLVFGIWLAAHMSQYDITDGWIIAAIVLWVIGSAIGGRLSAGYRKRAGEGGGVTPDSSVLVMNALMVLAVLAILIDMIWKPGAS